MFLTHFFCFACFHKSLATKFITTFLISYIPQRLLSLMTFSMKSASYEFSARDAVFSCLFAKYQIINSSNIIQTRGMLSGDEWKQDNTS